MRPWHDRILEQYALSLVGIPYIYGGQSPLVGFDCSGLIVELMRSVGAIPLKADLGSQGLFNLFSNYRDGNPQGAPSFGVLVFFGKSATEISHVGFCLDQYRMIESGGGDSSTKTKDDAISRGAYVRVRPILSRRDLVGYVKPNYSKIGAIG